MQPLGIAATAAPPATEVAGPDLARVSAVFLDTATDRVDTAINYGAYALAASSCPSVPATLATVAEHIPPELMPNAAKTARNVLSTGRFDEARLRDALACAMDPAELQVVRLEVADATFAECGWGVLSLHDVAAGHVAPLGWDRVPYDHDDGALLVAVSRLLEPLDARARRQGAPVPVLALDARLGGCPLIRAAVAERVPEHGLVVDRRYARERLVEDVYQQRFAAGGVAAAFGEWSLEAPPRPLPVKRTDQALMNEYAVPFTDGYERRYAIVRPAVAGTSRLTGRKRERRAAEIGEMIARLQPGTMARRLRVDTFRTTNDVIWRRHALLVSAMHDACTGLLTPSDVSLDRVVDALGRR